MKKILITGLIAVFSVVLTYGFADAGGPCVNCHTMHYSQNNAKPTNAADGGPFGTLLVANGCLGCHAKGTANNIEGGIPQVRHSNITDLAGGNFAYITTLKPLVSGTVSSVGHNLVDFSVAETTLTNPPGDEFGQTIQPFGQGVANFTCAGTNGCHGNRAVAGVTAAMEGAHHVSDTVLKFGTISEAGQGGTVGLSYRFLKGVKGGEQTNWMGVTPGSGVHNEYKGAISRGTESTISTPGGDTISGLCAECHGNFHGPGVGDIGTGPWLRHPTDIVLPADLTKEYQYYNSSAGGGAAAVYNIDAPVARVTILNSISSTVTPGQNDSIVMCLSCHEAHASANADILRWDYSTIQTGTGGNVKCFICHARKNQ